MEAEQETEEEPFFEVPAVSTRQKSFSQNAACNLLSAEGVLG